MYCLFSADHRFEVILIHACASFSSVSTWCLMQCFCIDFHIYVVYAYMHSRDVNLVACEKNSRSGSDSCQCFCICALYMHLGIDVFYICSDCVACSVRTNSNICLFILHRKLLCQSSGQNSYVCMRAYPPTDCMPPLTAHTGLVKMQKHSLNRPPCSPHQHFLL